MIAGVMSMAWGNGGASTTPITSVSPGSTATSKPSTSPMASTLRLTGVRTCANPPARCDSTSAMPSPHPEQREQRERQRPEWFGAERKRDVHDLHENDHHCEASRASAGSRDAPAPVPAHGDEAEEKAGGGDEETERVREQHIGERDAHPRGQPAGARFGDGCGRRFALRGRLHQRLQDGAGGACDGERQAARNLPGTDERKQPQDRARPEARSDVLRRADVLDAAGEDVEPTGQREQQRVRRCSRETRGARHFFFSRSANFFSAASSPSRNFLASFAGMKLSRSARLSLRKA